ncbi:MAG TPA: serine/threonine-protein kinase [Gemmatales bacterium]|nr:serine/threonine-protein kinase [Gemmatales bacterium]
MNPKLESLVDVWKAARDHGVELSVEYLCRDCPELRDEVRARLQELSAASTGNSVAETKTFQEAPPVDESSAPTLPPSKTEELSQPAGNMSQQPVIPGYRIERELGRGGMGVVYLATDLALQRPVAIKMGLTQASPSTQRRFQNEASALARLQHPHIVQVYAAGATLNGQTYFVMEYVSGGSLADRVTKVPQSIADSARLVQLLAKAVYAAHQRGIVHRDLKPANVLLAVHSDEPALNCAWGLPKIADFGLVKLLDNFSEENPVTTTGDLLGTPNYMAPEQARSGNAISHSVDIYALGAILYSLLAGRPPFQGGNSIDVILKVLEDQPPCLKEIRPEVPEELEVVCKRCLSKNPADRYETAEILSGTLGAFLKQHEKNALSSVQHSCRPTEVEKVQDPSDFTCIDHWPRKPTTTGSHIVHGHSTAQRRNGLLDAAIANSKAFSSRRSNALIIISFIVVFCICVVLYLTMLQPATTITSVPDSNRSSNNNTTLDTKNATSNHSVTDYVYALDFDIDQLDQWMSTKQLDNYMPVYISNDWSKPCRFNAIAVKNLSGELDYKFCKDIKHNNVEDMEHHILMDRNSYVKRQVCTYNRNGEDYLAILWAKSTSVEKPFVWGGPISSLGIHELNLRRSGNIFTEIRCRERNGSQFFSMLGAKLKGEWGTCINLPANELASTAQTVKAKGWYISWLDMSLNKGNVVSNIIMRENTDATVTRYSFGSGLTSTEILDECNRMKHEGFKPYIISTVSIAPNKKYYVAWKK